MYFAFCLGYINFLLLSTSNQARCFSDNNIWKPQYIESACRRLGYVKRRALFELMPCPGIVHFKPPPKLLRGTIHFKSHDGWRPYKSASFILTFLTVPDSSFSVAETAFRFLSVVAESFGAGPLLEAGFLLRTRLVKSFASLVACSKRIF